MKGTFPSVARVWLNKLHALCDVAEKTPDQVTAMLDIAVAAEPTDRNNKIIRALASTIKNHKDGTTTCIQFILY